MFSQIPSPANPELWAGIAAAAGAAFVFLRKIIRRKVADRRVADCQVPLTRAEFERGMELTRNRIGASHLALADKIDATENKLLAAIERLETKTEERLDRLDSSVARLDERTKAL